MRRSIGVVMLTLGVFFVALAPLLRFYAAPRLLVAPADEYVKITMTGQNGRYFSSTEGRTLQAPLVSTTTLRAAKGTSDTAVWDYFSALQDGARGTKLAVDTWRMAFDRTTAALKTCCGASVNGHPRVRQSGVGQLFAVGSVRKKTYQHFDPVTMRTWPAVYQGQETVGGLRAYRFTEKIAPTAIDEQYGSSGAALGLDPKQVYDFETIYSADITLWVDPRTGAIVDQRQRLDTRLRTLDGVDRVTAVSGDLRMTPATRRTLISKADDAATEMTLVRSVGPWAGLLLGVVLIAGAVLVRRRPRRGEHAATSEQTVVERA